MLISQMFHKRYFKNLILVIIITACFILVDLLTKYFVFNKNNDMTQNPIVVVHFIADWKVIGWRTQAHYSTTFLDLISASLPLYASLIIGYGSAAIFLTLALISNSRVIVIILAMSMSGALGNTIDMSYYGFVRNIMYLPWADRGTFNFADCFVIFGAPSAALSFLYYSFKK